MSARMPYPHERDEILRTIPESSREATRLIFEEYERCERALRGMTIEEFVCLATDGGLCAHDEQSSHDEGCVEGRKEMLEEVIDLVEGMAESDDCSMTSILEAIRAIKV